MPNGDALICAFGGLITTILAILSSFTSWINLSMNSLFWVARIAIASTDFLLAFERWLNEFEEIRRCELENFQPLPSYGGKTYIR